VSISSPKNPRLALFVIVPPPDSKYYELSRGFPSRFNSRYQEGIAMYQPGDLIIYWMVKHSDHPTPSATDLEPEPKGEGYRYRVKKYWLVTSVDNESIEVITRRGKSRRISRNDPQLRLARWWERFFFANRFPHNPTTNGNLQAKAS
jgi:hypothetical protein